MKILVTGGAGYIGSHTVVELLNAGHDVVVVDNLCNSSKKSLARVKKITGKPVAFYKVDIRDAKRLNAVLDKEGPFGAAIHFAALKAVGESTKIPLKYYNNNLGGTFTLLQCLGDHGCKNIVFSSSATVYGDPKSVPIREDFPTPGCTNAYGWTKLMMEQVFKDVQKADPEWNVILLRYFNPIGAHKSGLIGEDPAGIPNNLLPYVAQVAVGRRAELSATSRRSRSLRRTRSSVSRSTTSAQAMDIPSFRSSRRSRRHRSALFPTRSALAALATSRSAGPIRRWPQRSLAGRPSAALKRCAPMRGAGRRRTPTGTTSRRKTAK